MLKQFKILLVLSTLFFMGCSSIVHTNKQELPNNKIYAISSFWNYTETPMAGLKAASIVESVLAKENISLLSLIAGNEKESLNQNKISFLKTQVNKAKKLKASYLIMGEVQEWRYKTGIDGEPVVSYSVKVIELNTGNILFNAVGAKSGWGHKSIGIVAQEIAQEIIPQFVD